MTAKAELELKKLIKSMKETAEMRAIRKISQKSLRDK
jgi:hypothetical protein